MSREEGTSALEFGDVGFCAAGGKSEYLVHVS